ncbi:recombination mediator RecR [soil metagenome]
MLLPATVESLITEFSRFPGVGRRSAERMVFDLLLASPDRAETLATAVKNMQGAVTLCPVCGYFQEDGVCRLCAAGRSRDMLLVVEKPLDIVAIEKAGGYRGLYHVLGGHLSPLKGITPDQLRLGELYQRIREGEFQELILATSPSVEGDATALFITRELESSGLQITRLGRGVPMGGSLEYTDAGTLRMALEGRRGIDRR